MANKGPNPKSKGRGLIAPLVIGPLGFLLAAAHCPRRASSIFRHALFETEPLTVDSKAPQRDCRKLRTGSVLAPSPGTPGEGWGEGDLEQRTIIDKPDPFRFRCPLMRRGATVF